MLHPSFLCLLASPPHHSSSHQCCLFIERQKRVYFRSPSSSMLPSSSFFLLAFPLPPSSILAFFLPSSLSSCLPSCFISSHQFCLFTEGHEGLSFLPPSSPMLPPLYDLRRSLRTECDKNEQGDQETTKNRTAEVVGPVRLLSFYSSASAFVPDRCDGRVSCLSCLFSLLPLQLRSVVERVIFCFEIHSCRSLNSPFPELPKPPSS